MRGNCRWRSAVVATSCAPDHRCRPERGPSITWSRSSTWMRCKRPTKIISLLHLATGAGNLRARSLRRSFRTGEAPLFQLTTYIGRFCIDRGSAVASSRTSSSFSEGHAGFRWRGSMCGLLSRRGCGIVPQLQDTLRCESRSSNLRRFSPRTSARKPTCRPT